MLRLAIVPIVLLAMLAGAMLWSGRIQGKPADFTFVNRGENKTLDLGVMSWMQDIRIAYGLYEGLYTLDAKTLLPIPGCAEKIDEPGKPKYTLTPLDRGRVLIEGRDANPPNVYTFHIRLAAKWSNGDDLTANDFVFAWRRMLEQPSEYSYLVSTYIKGAQDYADAYVAWRKAVDEWGKKDESRRGPAPPVPEFTAGVEAIDAKTLRVTLQHPMTYFPALCAFPPFFPQHAGCMARFAQWDPTHTYIEAYDEKFTRPPNLVSNGPYMLTEWSFKRRVRMEAQPYYWNRSAVLSRVVDELYATEDGLAQYRIYESGGADWLSDVDGDLAKDLLDAGRKDLKLIPAFGTYFYDFNCNPTLPDGSKNPLANRRVRRALAMAVDKRPIVENVTRTGEPVADVYVPKGVFRNYPSPPGLHLNPDEARRLLAEAGFPGGAGFPHLRILFNNDFPQHGVTAQVIRRQWQQNLGIEVDLEGVEIKVFGARLHQHEFAIARGGWYGDYDDVSTFTDVYKSTSENNNPNWKSKEYDDLLAAAELEADPQKRLNLLADAENIFLEDAPILPLYQYVTRYLVHDNVEGIPLDPRGMVMPNAVKVNRR
jgi:oligopeptide transport system substrate-binding protein